MEETTGGEGYSEDSIRSLIQGYNEVLGEVSEEVEELRVRNVVLKGKLMSVERHNAMMETMVQRYELTLQQLEDRNAALRLKTTETRKEFLPKTAFLESDIGNTLSVVSDVTMRCILKTKLKGLFTSLREESAKLESRGEELRKQLTDQMKTQQVPERCIRCKTLFIPKLVLSVSGM